MPKLPLSSLLLFFFLRLTFLSSTPFRAFREAPAFRNHATCPSPGLPTSTIHIVMTLDAAYLRGSVAAVHSVLRHATCPENLFFHFISSPPSTPFLLPTISSTFPSLPFLIHPFHPSLVLPFISPSLRPALDQPLNYARIYLPHLLPSNVSRVLYLDSDLVLVDDVSRLWSIDLAGAPLAAPEYCHANFTSYFTHRFWSHPSLPNLAFGRKSGRSQTRSRGRPPCYFNTGVMVMDLEKWREGDYTRKLEGWMRVQKEEVRIYELGSLPPFLLVFAGEVKRVGHRWNQHGLGGDNARGLCRDLHPGKVSLLHWSGKGKPWLRLDAGRPCPVDALWAPYDLMKKMGRRRSGGGAAAAAEAEVDDDLFVEG